MSRTGAEHLSQTGMSEPSQTRVQGRSTSILLMFLSCLLNCTFLKAIKLLGNTAFISRRGNLCPSDRPSLVKTILKSVICVQAICFEPIYDVSQVLHLGNSCTFFVSVFSHRRGLTGWVFSGSDRLPRFTGPSPPPSCFNITLRRHIWEITGDGTKWRGRSSVDRL